MKEIWKDIDGFEGLYQVSNYGRVRSITRIVKKWDGERTVNGIVLKQAKNTKGYCFVQLYKNGIGKNAVIHRLVAQAFIPNPQGLPQVNHKDENKDNNTALNLEWCDGIYNARYGTRNSRVSQKKSKAIIVLDRDGNEVGRFDSLSSASKFIGRSKPVICGYIKRGDISPLGLLFKYL